MSKMRVEICELSKLPLAIYALWNDWIAQDPGLQSPFCHPEFSHAVNASSNDVFVAVAYDDNLPSAVLPFQRLNRTSAYPVGGYLSDHNGWISHPDKNLNLLHLLENTNLQSFRFHMLPVENAPPTRFWAHRRAVVHADVSGGIHAYTERKKQLGSNVVSKLAQKERKISREVGPLRLEEGYTDEAFDRLLSWKREACKKRSVRNILDTSPAPETLRTLTQIETSNFRGHFSRLMAGNQLVAVHLGMICHKNMAAWLPAFNPDFGNYSPGLLVLLQLIRNCEHWGIDRVDFGNGEFFFKDRFKTGETTMLEGIVSKSYTKAFLHNCWLRARDFAKSSELQPTLQRIWNYGRS